MKSDPQMSQRDLARALGISLGKANYCLQALIDRGLVKANNFKNSRNKQAYMYLLTPRGITEKARVAVRFLRLKMNEYERLQREIEQIRREIMDRFCGSDPARGESRPWIKSAYGGLR